MIDPSKTPSDVLNAAGFSRTALLPHTDRSLHVEPPSLLASLTVIPADVGGGGVVVDGAYVAAELRGQFGAEAVAGLSLSMSGQEGVQAIFGSRDGFQRIRYRDDEIAWPWHRDRPAEITARLRQLIKDASAPLALGRGDGYLLHNHRTLHGRSAFTGRRCVIRFLAKVKEGHPYAWLNRGFRRADS
ncbi:TauD/TfdA family dioxygenase [Solwaraspora sp. WMMA2080]|uniref:TauD/TfdA family dioxygenase n=1 Tax=unclassified Solwaraspora TaxID=2627926 RepID=UPI0032B2FE06